MYSDVKPISSYYRYRDLNSMQINEKSMYMYMLYMFIGTIATFVVTTI